MTKQEMLDKRSKLMFDAHAIMSLADVTTEQRTNVDKMLADANTLKGDVERMIQFENAEAEMRSVPGKVPQGAVSAAVVEPETRSYEDRRYRTYR